MPAHFAVSSLDFDKRPRFNGAEMGYNGPLTGPATSPTRKRREVNGCPDNQFT